MEVYDRIDKTIQEFAHSGESKRRKIKLPKIELKKFNAENKGFLSFRASLKRYNKILCLRMKISCRIYYNL